MAVISVKFLERLYTLAADPITQEKVSARGLKQGPTRAFIDWMDAVNLALKDILLETDFAVTDASLTTAGFTKNAAGVFIVNNLDFLGADVIRFDNVADIIVTGFLAGRPSQRALVVALGTGKVSLSNQDSLSLTANHIITTPRSLIDLAPGVGHARIYYDGTTQAWRVVQHEQGAPLTPSQSFLASAFTADGGTWTVPDISDLSGNLYTYYLKGAMLLVNLRLLATTVTGPALRLRVELPNDWVAKKHMANLGFVRDSNSTAVPPLSGRATLWQSDFSSRDINLEHMNGETILGSTDILGQCWIEIGSQGGEPGTGPSAGGTPPPPPDDLDDPATTTGTQPPRATVDAPTEQSVTDVLTAYNAGAGTTIFEINKDGGDPGFAWLDGAIVALRAAQGERWGYRANRGDLNTLSGDSAAYWYGVTPPITGGLEVYDFDLVIGSTGNTPTVRARDLTDYSGAETTGWAKNRQAGTRIGIA